MIKNTKIKYKLPRWSSFNKKVIPVKKNNKRLKQISNKYLILPLITINKDYSLNKCML